MAEEVENWLKQQQDLEYDDASPQAVLDVRFSTSSSSSGSEERLSSEISVQPLSGLSSVSEEQEQEISEGVRLLSIPRSSSVSEGHDLSSYVQQNQSHSQSQSYPSSLEGNVSDNMCETLDYITIYENWLSAGFDTALPIPVEPGEGSVTLHSLSDTLNQFFGVGAVWGKITAGFYPTVTHSMVHGAVLRAGSTAGLRMTKMNSKDPVTMESQEEYTQMCFIWLLAGFLGGRYIAELRLAQ